MADRKSSRRGIPGHNAQNRETKPLAFIGQNDSEGQAAAVVVAQIEKIARSKSCESLVVMDGNGAVFVLPVESQEAARRETREPQNVVGIWRRVSVTAMTLFLYRFRNQRKAQGA